MSNQFQAFCGTSFQGFIGSQFQSLTCAGDLLICGTFDVSHLGPLPVSKSVAIWDGKDFQQLGSGLNSTPNKIFFYKGDPYAIGEFTLQGDGTGGPFNHIARFDGIDWVKVGNATTDGGVTDGITGTNINDIVEYQGKLTICGTFKKADGVDTNIAQWDGSEWTDLDSLAVGMFDSVSSQATAFGRLSMLVKDGNLFVSQGVARISAVYTWLWMYDSETETWVELLSQAENDLYDSSAETMIEFQGNIYIGFFGCYDFFGPKQTFGIVRLDDNFIGQVVDGGMPEFQVPTQFVVHENQLVMVGTFTNNDNGTITSTFVMKWDGTNWLSFNDGFAPFTFPQFTATTCAVLGADLICGGAFRKTQDLLTDINNLTILDGDGEWQKFLDSEGDELLLPAFSLILDLHVI